MEKRKIILFIASSLDGYLAGSNDDLSWLCHDQDYGCSKFLERIDTILMGRRSWDVISSFGPWSYPTMSTYIFCHNEQQVDQENVQVINEDPIPFTKKELQGEGKDMWLFGGGQLINSFLQADLVDEINISIHPILLGQGIALFPPIFPTRQFKTVSTEQYPSGVVQITLQRQR